MLAICGLFFRLGGRKRFIQSDKGKLIFDESFVKNRKGGIKSKMQRFSKGKKREGAEKLGET